MLFDYNVHLDPNDAVVLLYMTSRFIVGRLLVPLKNITRAVLHALRRVLDAVAVKAKVSTHSILQGC
jgi:F420-0:gamma-glutamyl ligase-like protein